MNIVVIGTTYVDIKGYPLAEFIEDGRNVGTVEYVHGGVGRNVVENIANCVGNSTFVSVTDLSPLSKDILEHIEQAGVNTEFTVSRENGLGTWLAVFDDEGDVAASISKRPDLSPIAETLRKDGDEIYKNADGICVEIDIDEDILKETFALAEKYQKPVFALVSNMSLALERLSYLKKAACFVCNLQEAGMLFGEELTGLADKASGDLSVFEVADFLAGSDRRGISRLVVTCGAQGAAFADGITGESGTIPAKPVRVVDTTGAGDAFFSGIAIGLSYKLPLKKACEIGAELSASVITRKKNVCAVMDLKNLI